MLSHPVYSISCCYSFKRTEDGEKQLPSIYPRLKRFQQYSRYDHSLEFADKRYPLIHVARFYPQKNPDPAHVDYPQWCRFALMQHKPWHGSVLSLWKKYCATPLTRVDDIPSDVFIKAWAEFAETTGHDIALRIKSYRDEVSCERDSSTLGTFIDSSFLENELLSNWFCAADMIQCDADSGVREQLKNPEGWREIRRKATECFKKLGPNAIDDAIRFVSKNRKEGNAAPRPVPFVDPKTDLDKDQRNAWILIQMALTDSLPPNADGTDRQLLMHVCGDAGCGKSHLIHCLMTDPEFFKRGRVVTPTGTSAVQLGGNATTAHSKLYLPIGDKRTTLDMEAMRRLELEWPEGVRVLLIDEKGMLAQVLLAWIDIRLRALFDGDKPFGGIHVILLGDFQQLDPVQARGL